MMPKSPFGNDAVRRVSCSTSALLKLSRPSIEAVVRHDFGTAMRFGWSADKGVDVDEDYRSVQHQSGTSAGLCAAAMALSPDAAAAPLITGGYACIHSSAGDPASPVVAGGSVAAGGPLAADVCSPASAPVADMAGAPLALPGPVLGAVLRWVRRWLACSGGCAGAGGCSGGCSGAGGCFLAPLRCRWRAGGAPH